MVEVVEMGGGGKEAAARSAVSNPSWGTGMGRVHSRCALAVKPRAIMTSEPFAGQNGFLPNRARQFCREWDRLGTAKVNTLQCFTLSPKESDLTAASSQASLYSFDSQHPSLSSEAVCQT